MAFCLRRLVGARSCCHHFNRRSFHAASVLGAIADTGAWNKRWKPGFDVPETLEEKKEVAKKYGLTVEDYQPFDTPVHGDYPNMPTVPRYQRDGSMVWDEPNMRRNFNEPFPIDWDTQGEDRFDGTTNHLFGMSLWEINVILTGVFGALFLLYWFAPSLPMGQVQTTPRQYPSINTVYNKTGEKHYTFPTKGLDEVQH